MPSLPIKMKIFPILAKKPQKIVTKPSSQCAIPHENYSQPQISRNRLQPTQQSQIFEPSAEGTTPNQGPLPQPMNTPTIDTDEHYTMRYKINLMPRPLKTLYIILRSMLTNRHMYCILQIGSFNRAFKIILIQCYALSDPIRRISNYICQILFISRGRANKRSKIYINQVIYDMIH